MLFYYTSLSVLLLAWISQNFVFIAYANQKLWRKNLGGGGCRLDPGPWVTEGLKHISSLAVEGKYLSNVEAHDQEGDLKYVINFREIFKFRDLS